MTAEGLPCAAATGGCADTDPFALAGGTLVAALPAAPAPVDVMVPDEVTVADVVTVLDVVTVPDVVTVVGVVAEVVTGLVVTGAEVAGLAAVDVVE